MEEGVAVVTRMVGTREREGVVETETCSSGVGVNESVEFRIVRMSVVDDRQGVNR